MYELEYHQEVDKVVNFFKKYSHYKDFGKIKEYINMHIKQKTAFVLLDNLNEIMAVVRWEISPSGKIARVMDFIVRPDCRKYNRLMMKYLLTKGVWLYPKLTHITFERKKKYPQREDRIYSIKQFLGKDDNA